MDYDPVPELKRKHFEEALKSARLSVSEEDLTRYTLFQQKYDPNFKQQNGGGNNVGIDWGQGGGNMD